MASLRSSADWSERSSSIYSVDLVVPSSVLHLRTDFPETSEAAAEWKIDSTEHHDNKLVTAKTWTNARKRHITSPTLRYSQRTPLRGAPERLTRMMRNIDVSHLIYSADSHSQPPNSIRRRAVIHSILRARQESPPG